MNKKNMYNPRSDSSHLLGFNSKNVEISNIESETGKDDKGTKRYIWDKKGKTGVRMKTIRKQKSVDININSQFNNEVDNYDILFGRNSSTQYPVYENTNPHCLQEGENCSSAHLKSTENDNKPHLEVSVSNSPTLLQVVQNDTVSSPELADDKKINLQEPVSDNIKLLQVSEIDTTLCLPDYGNKHQLEIFANDTVSLQQSKNYSTNELPDFGNEELTQLQDLENNDQTNIQIFQDENVDNLQLLANESTFSPQVYNNDIVPINDKSAQVQELDNDKAVMQVIDDENMGNIHKLDDRTSNQQLIEDEGQIYLQVIDNNAIDCLQTVEDEHMDELQVLENVDKDLEALENNTDDIQVSANHNIVQLQVTESDKVHKLQIIGNESTIQEENEISYTDNNQHLSFTMSNIPTSWSLQQIHNYVQSECGPIKGVEFLNADCLGDVRDVKIVFLTQEQLERSKIILNEKPLIRGDVKFDFEDDFFIQETDNSDEGLQDSEFDIWDYDPEGLYGLKPEFLESLNIKPPINNWVHVTNFRCEKSELRDAMEIAGRVLFCTVVSVYTKYAKVMYSHPLEAVQAVSMLDGQKFYGHTLNVTMDVRTSKIIVLPKGLKRLGPGLGRNGKVITNIGKHYERYIKNEKSLINPRILREIHRSDNISHEKPEGDRNIDRNDDVKHEKPDGDFQEGNDDNNKHKSDDEVINEIVSDNVNADISNEEKQSENIISNQDATEIIDPSSPSQNLVSKSVNSPHTPLLPAEVRLSPSAARKYNVPISSPQMPRILNPVPASLANLPPAYIRSTLMQNMYINCLHRPKPRTPIVVPRVLDRFRSPRNCALPGSSGCLPSIPESIETSSLGSNPRPSPPGPTNVGFRPPVSSHGGCPLTGLRHFEINASGSNALEMNRFVPISSGLQTLVTSQLDARFHAPTAIRFEAPISTRFGFGINGSRPFGSRPLRPVLLGLGVPQPRPIEFAIPVSYSRELGVPKSTSNGFRTPEPSFVGPGLPTPRPLWMTTPVPSLLEPSISEATSLEYMPPGSSRPFEPSTLVSQTSGPDLLKSVPSGASHFEGRPGALPPTPGPGPLQPFSLDPRLTPDFSGASSLKYGPGGLSPRLASSPLGSIDPESVCFESGLNGPTSIGFPCSASSSLASGGSKTTSSEFDTPGSSFDGSGLVGIPPHTGSGPVWYSTSGTSFSRPELSGPSSIERQLSGLAPPLGISVPPTTVSGLSHSAQSGSRTRGFAPPRTRRSRQPRLSGFLPVQSCFRRSLSSESGCSESEYQELGSQTPGPTKLGSNMFRRHASFKTRSAYSIPRPSDPAQTSRSFQSPATYISVPEVKLDMEGDEVMPGTSSGAPEASTNDILTNLPPYTTLQMLCDNFSQYEEEIAKNNAHQMSGYEFTNNSQEEGCNPISNQFSGDV